MDRREFLKTATVASLAWLMPGTQAWAFNNANESDARKKLIVILLRGGMDGLNVVAPVGDRLYYQIRPGIALGKPGTDGGALDLDGYFGLHPAMETLMPFWQNKSLAFVHSSGSPDPTRSHFDAQDYMESGTPGDKNAQSGWLNRLVQQLPPKHSPIQAVSLGPTLPRMCTGTAQFATIAKDIKPSKSVLDRPVIASAFGALYGERNDDLGKAYREGMSAHKEINEVLSKPDADSDADQGMSMEQKVANAGAPTPRNYPHFGKQLANLFRKSPTLQIAFLDLGGWDTHVNQGNAKGQLANHLRPLAQGLADLCTGLGPLYKDTTIVVMSEFGRTAHENGNSGTDHGHGNVMMLLGGGTDGGKIFGRWAGLAPNQLHEARDLPTTTDFRAVLAYILNNQLEVPSARLGTVFPQFNITNPWVQA